VFCPTTDLVIGISNERCCIPELNILGYRAGLFRYYAPAPILVFRSLILSSPVDTHPPAKCPTQPPSSAPSPPPPPPPSQTPLTKTPSAAPPTPTQPPRPTTSIPKALCIRSWPRLFSLPLLRWGFAVGRLWVRRVGRKVCWFSGFCVWGGGKGCADCLCLCRGGDGEGEWGC